MSSAGENEKRNRKYRKKRNKRKIKRKKNKGKWEERRSNFYWSPVFEQGEVSTGQEVS